MSKLWLSNSHGIDLDLLMTTRLLIQASSGAGKSVTIRKLIEEAFGKVQIIVIDPEGEFANMREQYDFVLVGKGGDVPADVRSAELLAHKLLELNASAICDIYELPPDKRHEWVQKFLDALVDAPKKLWRQVLVIVDEAHLFCPEKGAGESIASNAMISLATRGRKRGYCAVWATQRLGKLRKDAASELQNVLIGRTWLDVDRGRAMESLGVLKDKKTKEEFMQAIKMLPDGAFYALGRAISTELIKIQVDLPKTFRKAKELARMTTPPPTEKVKAMLSQLADLPQEAEKKAKTIKDLEHDIRVLRGQLAARVVSPEDQSRIEDKIRNKCRNEALEAARQESKDAYNAGVRRERERLLKSFLAVQGQIAKILEDIRLNDMAPKLEYRPAPKEAHIVHEPRVGSAAQPTLRIPHGDEIVSTDEPVRTNGKLRAGAERMLAALCQFSDGMPEGQMRSHAGMKKSGTFNTYKSDLRQGGYIEERGGLLFPTRAAFDYFGSELPQSPTSTEEVLAIWNPKLREGARRMLEIIVQYRGSGVNREKLAQLAGMSLSGTFNTYLSDLRTARLIKTSKGQIWADKDTLFL